MEDPTTVALNLTFFGTVFVAFLMSLGLFISFIVMLVIAGVSRLLVLIVMALFGRIPKNDTVEVVRLPADTKTTEALPPKPAKVQPAKAPRAPRPVRAPRPSVDWKTLMTRAGLQSALRTAVADHPLLTAARPVPPVLAKDWAEAVAAADARAVARARETAPVLDIPVPEAPVTGVGEVVKVAPLVESALHGGEGAPVNQVPPRPTRAPRAGASGPDAAKGAGSAPQVQPVQSSLAASAQPARPAKKPADVGHMAVLDTGSMVSLAQHTENRVRS
ncbi:hypothetical protein [Arthrobacter sp. NPDC093139]|uniref:hypothetical protein n=1 Tax=Arthrobacter sp. NPDC093139 TaxID=3363945 RepID=UPI00381489DF